VDTSSGDGDSDDELPTIEQILYSTLPRDGFITEDSSLENTVQGFEGVACEEVGGFIDHSRSALGNNLGRSSGERANRLWPWNRI